MSDYVSESENVYSRNDPKVIKLAEEMIKRMNSNKNIAFSMFDAWQIMRDEIDSKFGNVKGLVFRNNFEGWEDFLSSYGKGIKEGYHMLIRSMAKKVWNENDIWLTYDEDNDTMVSFNDITDSKCKVDYIAFAKYLLENEGMHIVRAELGLNPYEYFDEDLVLYELENSRR